MTYKTSAALEMAVKQAARESPQDTNRAIAGFWHSQRIENLSFLHLCEYGEAGAPSA